MTTSMRRFLPYILIVTAFLIVWIALLVRHLNAVPPDVTYSNDAQGYHLQAVHLIQDGIMSLDGVHASTEHEPMYILFLSAVYKIFGIGNRLAVFIAQTLIFLFSVLFFTSELQKQFSKRTATLACIGLLFLPTTFVMSYVVNRELLALSFFLISFAFLFRASDHRQTKDALGAGIFLGCLALTYFAFAPFALIIPIFCLYFLSIFEIHAVMISGIVACMIFGLFLRNNNYTGDDVCMLPGCVRGAFASYVKGEQIEHLSLTDPWRCLWGEYVTHDAINLPQECFFGKTLSAKWPGGFVGHEKEIREAGEEARSKIFTHPIQFSSLFIASAAEYQFPFFFSGRLYNVLTTIVTALILCSMIFSLSLWRERIVQLFVFTIIYGTLVFSLVDVVPRYKFPIIFAYIVLATLGIQAVFRFFRRLYS